MKIPATFLRSKVAHRIVLLFFACALLPVTLLMIVSFHEVASQLRQESQKRLTQASRGQGMEIFERLTMIESSLLVLSSESQQPDLKALEPRFQGLSAFTVNGSAHFQRGTAPPFPQLTSAEQQHLATGRSLVRVGNCTNEGSNCISMVRMTHGDAAGSSLLVGDVNPEYLFSPQNLPTDIDVCALTSSGITLFCSNERAVAQKSISLPNRASGLVQWQNDDTKYDAAYWKLLIRPAFFAEPWIIFVIREHSDVVAPILRFSKSFSLVILLSLWIVLFFSMVQIRRTLVPLGKLREGTDKIGAGQFHTRVSVHSGDEFEGLAGSFNAMASQLGQQFLTLKTINAIDQAIFASLDRDAIVDGVLARMPSLLPGDGFGVCVFDDARSSSWVRFRDVATGQIQTQTLGVDGTDWLQLQCNQNAFTLSGEQDVPDYLHALRCLGMQTFLVLPIRVDGSIEAALVCARREGSLSMGIQEARSVADQLAVAFSHVHLINALEELLLGTLTALARAIDAKSEWTAGHSERVTKLALEIGRNMGLSPNDLRVMHMGGLLHDIGKIGTPPAVLDKPGKLTAEEMSIMQDHVSVGVRILEPIPGFREALPIVAQHHEWFNGKGYPAGVGGSDINLNARILAVADCYDAITSDRPYRKGLPGQETVAMLAEKSGTQFDPDVIEAFVRTVASPTPEKMMTAPAGVSR
jgi:putative nucleotidyltransferase with HDIG domain